MPETISSIRLADIPVEVEKAIASMGRRDFNMSVDLSIVDGEIAFVKYQIVWGEEGIPHFKP